MKKKYDDQSANIIKENKEEKNFYFSVFLQQMNFVRNFCMINMIV